MLIPLPRPDLWRVIVQARSLANRINGTPIEPIVVPGCWP